MQELANPLCLKHIICIVNHFICYQSLHLKHREFPVGNGQFISVLFIIPIIVDKHGHRFEIYKLVSEIHENVDLDLGSKKISELEGIINSCDCGFNFLNKSLPFFQNVCIALKLKEQRLIKVEAPFIDKNIRTSHN